MQRFYKHLIKRWCGHKSDRLAHVGVTLNSKFAFTKLAVRGTSHLYAFFGCIFSIGWLVAPIKFVKYYFKYLKGPHVLVPHMHKHVHVTVRYLWMLRQVYLLIFFRIRLYIGNCLLLCEIFIYMQLSCSKICVRFIQQIQNLSVHSVDCAVHIFQIILTLNFSFFIFKYKSHHMLT